MKRERRINVWDGRSKNEIVSAINNILGHKFYEINTEQPFSRRREFLLNTFIGKASNNFIHWPDEPFWLTRRLILNVFLCMWILVNFSIRKLRGFKTIWLVHNLEPHNLTGGRKVVWNLYLKGFLRLVDVWVVMSPKNKEIVKRSFPILIAKPGIVLLHPPYYTANKRKKTRNLTIGHVGMIREYKNLTGFLQGHKRLFTEKNLKIKIAGTFERSEFDKLSILQKSLPNMSLLDKYLTGEQYNEIVSELDLMICAYQTSFHSGVIIHSICSNVPVLASKNNFTEDLRDILGKNAIIYPDELSADLVPSLSCMTPQPSLRDVYIKAYEKSEKRFLADLEKIISKTEGNLS